MIVPLSSLSAEQKIGQLFFIGIPGPVIDEAARELLSKIEPGGICLFARNIRDAEQTRGLLNNIRETLSTTPFLSLDQEGGLVDRLKRIMTPMPAPGRLQSGADAAELAAIIGETLRILGFNMDFAPVVDVIDGHREKYTNGLFSRTFGNSKEDTALFAGEFVNALQAKGIFACLKHFPGLGAARVDSHEELPAVELSESELNDTDLYPYRRRLSPSNIRVVMAAHASFPRHRLQELDQNGKLLPSSLSFNFITNLLRGELGFDGLVITDDLEMGAIIKNYGVGEACKMAINAGVDMLAICARPSAITDGYNAVVKAVKNGEIGMDRIDISLERIAKLKTQLFEPTEFDRERLEGLKNMIAGLNSRLSI